MNEAHKEKKDSKENTAQNLISEKLPGATITPEEVKNLIFEHITKDKSSLITVFGIFASIIAFLLIEVQIIKNVFEFWRILGFSFFLLGSLLSFIFVLQYIAKSWIERDQPLSIILALLIIVISFALAFLAIKKSDWEIRYKEKIGSKYIEETSPLKILINQNKLEIERLKLQLEKKQKDPN